MYSLEQELSGQDIERIKDKFEENARVINEGLAGCLDIGGGDYAGLTEAMGYSGLSGGKRIRGFLTRACFEVFNGYRDDELILPVACAVELVHAYSLVHDDLPCMDNDDMRRGQPTSHVKFGEATAVLAGDALLAHAFSILADAEKLSAEVKVKVISEISRAAGYSGMVGGQAMDLEYGKNKGGNRDAEIIKLIKLQSLKTGALIMAAARAGCIAAGAGEKQTELVGEYAKNIGLAFQVIDDSFDGDGFAAVLGGDAPEYARQLTLEALLQLEKLKELSAGISAWPLEAAAKYLLYRKF